MNATRMPEDLDLAVIELDATPQSLRLPAGSAVFALRGELWLTQDGFGDDVMLRAGARYDLHGGGTLVVSATVTPAALVLCPAAQARVLPTADLPALLRARAARLREAARERAWTGAAAWLQGLLRGQARKRDGGTSRPDLRRPSAEEVAPLAR